MRSSGHGAPPAITRLRPRSAVLAAGVALAVGWAGASTGRADTDFGTVGLDGSSFGSLASLSTPSAVLFQESDEFVVHRTVVQSSYTATDPGLIQAGVYRSGSGIQLDNCGARPGYTVFTEVKQYGSMAYKCQLYQSVAPGTVVTLDIYRVNAAASWGIRINGASTGAYQLGFNRGAAGLGSEIQDVDGNHGTHTATRFGPAGHAAWTIYAAVGRGRPRRVSGAQSMFDYPPMDPFWTLPHPPARMTIKHRQ